jgi:DNA end-binding protein Ku
MPRAFWKGYLKLSLVSCPIALYPAVSKSERPKFHRIHRQTGRRLRQQMVEPENLEPVEKDDIARGYEIEPSRSPAAAQQREGGSAPRPVVEREGGSAPRPYVEIENEDLEQIEIANTHSIDIEHFVRREEIDDRYLNAPYYAVPVEGAGQEAYVVIRDAMKSREMAALARVVLTRREHAVMVEPFGKGLLAVTLRYPYELRDETAYFEKIPDLNLPKEMKDLALHIVKRMEGHFDPAKIEDRYKKALDALIASKLPGGVVATSVARPEKARVINLMDALKSSVQRADPPKKQRRR